MALVFSLAIVLIGNLATDIILGHRPWEGGVLGSIDAIDVFLLHLLFTGLPFFVLAARADPRPAMWGTALMLTLAFWVYFNWQIWQDSLTDFAGGANIGLGMVMMVAPVVILLILKALSMLLRGLAR